MGVPIIGSVGRKVFGSRNDRLVKRYMRLVDQVSSREQETRLMDDEQLKAKTVEFRNRIDKGELAVDLIPEVFAVAREAMDRAVGIRNIFNPIHDFDSSLLDDSARLLYEETKTKIAEIEPRNPDQE